MLVEAAIRTGDRSVLEYLFSPIYNSLNTAFRGR
jgi:hypothetical protein